MNRIKKLGLVLLFIAASFFVTDIAGANVSWEKNGWNGTTCDEFEDVKDIDPGINERGWHFILNQTEDSEVPYVLYFGDGTLSVVGEPVGNGQTWHFNILTPLDADLTGTYVNAPSGKLVLSHCEDGVDETTTTVDETTTTVDITTTTVDITTTTVEPTTTTVDATTTTVDEITTTSTTAESTTTTLDTTTTSLSEETTTTIDIGGIPTTVQHEETTTTELFGPVTSLGINKRTLPETGSGVMPLTVLGLSFLIVGMGLDRRYKV